MTGPAAPRVAPGPAEARVPHAGRVGAQLTARPTAASKPGHLPSSLGPVFHGSQLRVPRRLNPRSKFPLLPLPLQGRYSRLRRGGVAINGLRSRRRGESATGPELRDGKLKPHVPASSRLLFFSLRSRTSTLLLGSLARGRGARAPPPPRTQTAVPRDVAALNFAN